MSLRDNWKKTGKELGTAFADLGKSLILSVGKGVDKLEDLTKAELEKNEAENKTEEENK